MTALLKNRHMNSEIGLLGMAAVLDLSGALYLADEDTLLVADLHFEKGSFFAKRGMLLPPYDTRATMAILRETIVRIDPRRVIALGDSFHDIGGPGRLGDEERTTLAAVQQGRDWVWIAGNHDHTLPESVGGQVLKDMSIGTLTLRHEPQEGAHGEIAGHLHPIGKVAMRGRSTRRRCFLTDGSRCIMPAIGVYTGGLNACDAIYKPLFPKGFTAHLIGTERIFAISQAMLCRD